MRKLLPILAVLASAQASPVRVLLIGNSYTYYNHLAGLVEAMAAAAGQTAEVRSVTRGGATLETMYTASNARQVLRGSRWDYVVLQEQSTLGLHLMNGDPVVNDPAAFHSWVRIWDGEIRAAGAKTALLNTWSRENRRELQPKLDWAYTYIAKELNAVLIPAGAAFQISMAASPELKLYVDGGHPAAEGSYLTACVIVETLFGTGCAAAPDAIPGVPMDNAKGRLKQGEPGPIVSLDPLTASKLRTYGCGAVRDLQAAGGYWTLPKPPFTTVMDALPAPAPDSLKGLWRGSTWLYGKKAEITLRIVTEGAVCDGTWTIAAGDPITLTTLPLANCVWNNGRLRFTVRTLFLTSETHEARMAGDSLAGIADVRSSSGYHRQSGTWDLRRVPE